MYRNTPSGSTNETTIAWRRHRRFSGSTLPFLFISLFGLVCHAMLAQGGPEPTEEKLFSADPVAEVLKRAKGETRPERRPILVIVGSDWCGWCHKLWSTMVTNRDLKVVLGTFVVKRVDIGKFNRNMEIAEMYEIDLQAHGIPYLLILDGDAKLLAKTATSVYEEGGEYSVPRLLSFLRDQRAKAMARGSNGSARNDTNKGEPR